MIMTYKKITLKTAKMDSNISFIKCVAIFLIAISHSLPYLLNNIGAEGYQGVIDLDKNSGNSIQIYLAILRNYGQIGNLLFLISSAWLLVSQNRVRIRKIINLIIDNVAITWSLTFIAIYIFGYKLQPNELRKFIFPTAFSTNWYVSTYIFLYFLHGILNNVIESLNRRKLLLINYLLFFMYFFLVWWKGIFQYSALIGFISVYLIVGYYKIYIYDKKRMMEKRDVYRKLLAFFLVGTGMHLLSVIIIFYVGAIFKRFSDDLLRLNTFTNPIFFVIAMSFFLLVVYSGRLKNGSVISNSVNNLSRLSLYIYLIHGSTLMVRFLKTEYYDYVYRHDSFDKLGIWMTLYLLVSLLFAILFSLLYNISLGKVSEFVSIKMEQLIDKWVE